MSANSTSTKPTPQLDALRKRAKSGDMFLRKEDAQIFIDWCDNVEKLCSSDRINAFVRQALSDRNLI